MIIFASWRKKSVRICVNSQDTLSLPISLSAVAALTACLSRPNAAAASRQQVSEPEAVWKVECDANFKMMQQCHHRN